MRRIFFCSIVAILFFVPALCAAIAVPVSLAPSELRLGQRMGSAPSHAVVRLIGRGEGIAVRYGAPEPVTAIVTFADGKAVPDLTTSLVAELPAGADIDASLDVSASPAWSLADHEYRVFFFPRAAAGTSIDRVTLLPIALRRLPVIAMKQFFTPEPYLPSTYHRLKGERVLGIAAPLIVLSIALLLIAAVLAMRRFAGKRFVASFSLLSLLFLLTAARSSVDLLTFTARHLTMWYGNEPYEQAGSAYAIADFFGKLPEEGILSYSPIFLCSEGTSYIPALMTYLLYPRRVTQPQPGTAAASEGQAPATIIAFQPPVQAGENGPLHCGDRTFASVKPLKTFADDSVVYSVLKP